MSDEINESTENFAEEAELVDAAPGSGLSRRTFLKAAALGTAAAALMKTPGGLVGTAFAGTTNPSCTANDIDVSGGQVTNAPCDCTTGSFTPTFSFQVTNNNNANRTCITLILGTSTNATCNSLLSGATIFLENNGNSFIGGNGTTLTMTGQPKDSSGNPIQIPCDFGQCCFTNSIVAFQTSQNKSNTTCTTPLTLGGFPGGQCRRETICLTAFGVSVACADSSCNATAGSSCSVPCGGSLNLVATAIGGTAACASATAPSMTLTGPDGTVYTATSTTGSTSGGFPMNTSCFAVSSPVKAGTYTVTATDCNGCQRTATISVTSAVVTAHLAVSGNSACNNGQLTFTGSVDGCASGITPTYTFSVDGVQKQSGSSSSFTYNPSLASGGGLDTGCHTVSVTANCSGCTSSATRSVSQCVTSTVTAEGTTC